MKLWGLMMIDKAYLPVYSSEILCLGNVFSARVVSNQEKQAINQEYDES